MHIAIISDGTAKPGGWYSYTDLLSNSLADAGHTVCSIVPKKQPLSFLTNPFTAPWQALKLRGMLEKCQPDIVHITVEPLALMVPFWPKALREKTVVTVHGSYGVRLFHGWWNARRSCRLFAHVGACITVSAYTKQRLLEEEARHCGAACSQKTERMTTVVHNAVRLPPVIGQKKQGNVKRIICVGGIKPRKGILESLRALAVYRERYGTPFQFTIIGSYKEDAYVREVRSVLRPLGMTETVEITGAVSPEQLDAHFRSADVLLMPAKTTHDTFEGFGLVYIEANAYGVPCIGPTESGAIEAITEGETGFRVDPNDPEAIAHALHRILDEGVIRGDDCRAWAAAHDVETMSRKIEEVYALLAAPAASAGAR